MPHILYATDGSQGALEGAQFLTRLPRSDGRVTLLTVLPGSGSEDPEAAQAPAREVLHAAGIPVRTEVRFGNPAEEILHFAESVPTDLIVVGSRGIGAVARFLLGSVAERVARHAVCPVLLARPLVHDLKDVILGFDGSEEGERVAEWLARFPLPEATALRIVTVIPVLHAAAPTQQLHWPPEITAIYNRQKREAEEKLAALEEKFRRLGRQASTDLRSGDPANVLLQLAEEQRADLITVGSSGMGMIERFLLGSVSEKVLQYAPCSVLVFKGSRSNGSQPS